MPLLSAAIASGLVIRFIGSEAKLSFYAVHQSLGLVILLLAIARLVWRLRHAPPPLPASTPVAARAAAGAMHGALYLALILQPAIGFLATNAYGFPLQGSTAFLGLVDMPKFMATNEPLAGALGWAHSLLGWALPVLLAGHVAAAIHHHAVRRDGTLLRML